MGVCFSVYNGLSAVMALLLPLVARRTSRRFTHMLALVLGGVGLISIYFIHDYHYILLSMVGVGIAWASILSVPYARAMLARGPCRPIKWATTWACSTFSWCCPRPRPACCWGP
ncbi:MAG: hypothetical protein WKG07_12140 [Hymenobacter sp.]